MKKLSILFFVAITLLFVSMHAAPSVFAGGSVQHDFSLNVVTGAGSENRHKETLSMNFGQKLRVDISGLKDGKEFAFYVYNGQMETNEEALFMISGSTNLSVVLKDKESDVVAAFVDTNGELIDVKYSEVAFTPSYGDLSSPSKPGYEFDGYDVSQITEDTVFVAKYSRTNQTPINVTITGGTEDFKVVQYNDVVTLQPADMDNFKYWADANGKFVSSKPNYKFTALKDVTFEAVTVGEAHTNPAIYLSNVSGITPNAKSFLGYIEGDFVEYGLLASNKEEVLTLDTLDVTVIPSQALNPETNEFLRSIPETEDLKSFRAYAKLADGGVVYSENNFVSSLALTYETGFNDSEGFSNNLTSYQSSSYQTLGESGKQWSINYGLFSSTDALEGDRSAQFRTYKSGGGYGNLYSDFTLQANTISFKAKSELDTLNIEVSISTDKSNWTHTQVFDLNFNYKEYTYKVNLNEPVYVKFTVVGSKDDSTRRVYVDEVKSYNQGSNLTNMYTVKYFDGAELAGTSYVRKGELASDLPFSLQGHTFNYWMDENNQEFNFNSEINSHLDLYANVTINKYDITFNSNDGTVVDKLTDLDYGSIVNKPEDPTRDGYTFDGWYTNGGLTNAVVWPHSVPAYSGTLYAKWILNDYTITFESDGGTSVPSITQGYNTSIIKPEDPTMEGFVFVGWFDESNQLVTWPYSMPLGGMELTAQWQDASLSSTVTFEVNGGSEIAPVVVSNGEVVLKPIDPTKEGYIFDGWFSGVALENEYNFDTPVNTDITLYAKWVIEVTYTFTSNSWGANKTLDGSTTKENWTSGKAGNGYNSNQGIQVSTGASGANGTSPTITNIVAIEVIYATNAKNGVGSIEVKIGSTIVQEFAVTKVSGGGDTPRSAGIIGVNNLTGPITITVTCTTNSVYINSINITFQE